MVCSWYHLLQMPIVMVTFIPATFVLATFVQIRKVSAVTDLILTKFFGANILRALIHLVKLWHKLFWNQKIGRAQHFLDPTFFVPTFFRSQICEAQYFFGSSKIFVKTPTQRQLNNNSTKVGFDMKMTVQTTPPYCRSAPTLLPQCTPQKLNVCNISAVTDPIVTKI